jgi:hypothetical protein
MSLTLLRYGHIAGRAALAWLILLVMGAAPGLNAADSAPTITTQPSGRFIGPGQTATFTVVATGSPAPTYQWQKDSDGPGGNDFANIPGATGSSYTTPSAVLADDGDQFRVLVTNSVTSITSKEATLTVKIIHVQPWTRVIEPGKSATFSVLATATPAPTYQWQTAPATAIPRDTDVYTNISGATGADLVIPNVSNADSGKRYRVVVSTNYGAVTSNRVALFSFDPATAGTGASTIDESLVTQTLNVRLAAGLPGSAFPFGLTDNTADGSLTKPYATLKQALARAGVLKNAGTGVRIRIAAGTYREGSPITNPNGGSYALEYGGWNSTAPLVIEGAGWNAANPSNTGDVIISGSESEDWSGGWTKTGTRTWTKPWPYNWGVPKPNVDFGVSDAFLRRELVHVNGATFYQVNPETNPNGTPYTNQRSVDGKYGGFAEGGGATADDDLNGGRLTNTEGRFWVQDAVRSADYSSVVTFGSITIQLPSGSPDLDLNAGQLVEVTSKWNLLQIYRDPRASGPTNVILRNLTFQHAGAGYGALIQGQDNLLVEDCRFINNKHTGLLLSSNRNVTLRRVTANGNGENGAGIVDTWNGLLDQCTFANNSRQGEILGYTGWSVCGVKLYSAAGINLGITMRRCVAKDNRSAGFWWDTGNARGVMEECVSIGNSTMGTFIEDNNDLNTNYENAGPGTKGINGISNLGTTIPTVTARRSIFANNKPAASTTSYRFERGRGIFFSENENAVIEDCLIYGSGANIATYDNSRAENRNFTFKGNLVAVQSLQQRLYAVGSTWDSGNIITARNANGITLATFKGGWHGLFDGLSGTTNDNVYFAPVVTAFMSRDQRWGMNKWGTNFSGGSATPAWTLAQWQAADRDNNLTTTADQNQVDTRSTLIVGTYDENRPLVMIDAEVTSLAESDGSTTAFTVRRVSAVGYDAAITVNYSIRANSGDATNSSDVATLSGTVSIPAGARSATIAVDPLTDGTNEAGEPLALVLTPATGYVVGRGTASLTITNVAPASGAPSISTQPANVTATAGNTATFTVTASGTPAPTYQWQSKVSGGTFADISGATAATYSFTAAAGDAGKIYRVVVQNTVSSVTSNEVTLTVNIQPVITLQPVSTAAKAGDTASFTVGASGSPAPTFQWQVKPAGGTFANISGATAATYSFTVAAADAGKQFQVIVSNVAGPVTSNVATFTLNTLPVIATQPANQAVATTAFATFSVVASGTPAPGYQWQWAPAGSSSFVNIPSGTGSTSVTTSYTTAAAVVGDNGRRYRVLVSNSVGTVTSSFATLSVGTAPTISGSVASKTVNASATTSFTVSVSGDPTPTVQWQSAPNTGAFSNVAGATALTYVTPATVAADDGRRFRAVVTNGIGTVTSNAAVLTVNYAPVITTAPGSLTVTAGTAATFSVVATGNPAPSYQWQVKPAGGSFSNAGGATTTSYNLSTTAASDSGLNVRVVVSNGLGTVTSSPAVLTVNAPVVSGITLFGTTVPTPSGDDDENYELGVKFKSSSAGQITAIRVFRAAASLGSSPTSYTGRLWTAGGTQLASVTINAPTAGAWAEASLSSPVSISANTTYVVSYNVPKGKWYQATNEGLINAKTSGALSTIADGKNGVYAVGMGTFPTKDWKSSNYYADVRFVPTASVAKSVALKAAEWSDVAGATGATLVTSTQTLADSGSQYRVVVNNSVGSVTSDPLTLTVEVKDTTPPATPAAPSVNGLTISGSTEPNAVISVTVDGIVGGSVTAAADGAWSWTAPSTIASGSHPITVTATDAAGNRSTASPTVTMIVAPAGSGGGTTPPPAPAPSPAPGGGSGGGSSNSAGGGGGGGGCGAGGALALMGALCLLRRGRR